MMPARREARLAARLVVLPVAALITVVALERVSSLAARSIPSRLVAREETLKLEGTHD